jgi:hypothetical protein
MRAEIYSQLIKMGFEEEEAIPMSEEFARALSGLGTAGYKLFGWAAKAIVLSLIESWVVAILF